MLGGSQSEFEKICNREIELTTKKRAAVASLAEAREAAAIAMVNGDSPAEIGVVTRHAESVGALTRAIELIRHRRAEAFRAENEHKAAAERATAAGKERELSTLQGKLAKLLAEIGKLEGVNDKELSVVGASDPRRSDILRVEIDSAVNKAVDLESASLPTSGRIELDDITDDNAAVAAVLAHRSAGPSADAVLDWLASCASDKRLNGQGFGVHPRRIDLSWENGVIQPNSAVQCRGVAKTFTVTIPGRTLALSVPDENGRQWQVPWASQRRHSEPSETVTRIDIESATFRPVAQHAA